MKKLAILLTVLFAAVSVYAGNGYGPTDQVTASTVISVRVINPLAVVAPTTLPTLPVVIDETVRDFTDMTMAFEIKGEANEAIAVTTPGYDGTKGGYVCATTGVVLKSTWGTAPLTLGDGTATEFTVQTVNHTLTLDKLDATGATVGTASFDITVKAEYTGL